MKRIVGPFAAAAFVALIVSAPCVAAAGGGGASAKLLRGHTNNVAESLERILATGKLSPEHELATREGLAAYLAARADGSRPEVVDPNLPSALISLEDDPGLAELMVQPPTPKKGLSPHPSGINSVGAVVCSIGDELLVNGRFVLVVTYQGFVGPVTRALSCRMTNSAGYFFFFDRTNVEVPLKVLNACFGGSPPGHWLFAAGLTNFAVEVAMVDLFTGQIKTYFNPLGQTFSTIIDQQTPFPCP